MTETKDKYWGMNLNRYCMCLHLRLLTSVFTHGIGAVIPHNNVGFE